MLPQVSAAKPPADEGAIHFAYGLAAPAQPAVGPARFGELRAWRQICKGLGLLGQDPGRYAGFGFGNLSVRDPERPREFVITASQTGGADDLHEEDLVRIIECSLARFWVEAEGNKPPSSETLTHAMIYAADPGIHWILHAHSPDVWASTERLGLPCTAADVPYGSPDMAAAVARLVQGNSHRPLVFTTLGHEDGVFACGAQAHQTGLALVAWLAEALT
jgi:hypothetical protein